MSSTTYKLAVISYLIVEAKSNNIQLGWTDIVNSIKGFGNSGSANTYADLIQKICEIDTSFSGMKPHDQMVTYSEQSYKSSKHLHGRIRNLCSPNGLIARTTTDKNLLFQNHQKNGPGNQACPIVEIPLEKLTNKTIWDDLSKKVTSGYSHQGSVISTDLLLGIVWDQNKNKLEYVSSDGLLAWCNRIIDSNKTLQKKIKKAQKKDKSDKNILELLIQICFSILVERNIEEIEVLTTDSCEDQKGDYIPKFEIYFGPPGTGKTHKVKENFKENSVTELVQIHPTYTYEDLIEGVQAIIFSTGEPKYDVVDGVVKILSRWATGKPAYILVNIVITEDTINVLPPLGTKNRYKLDAVKIGTTSSKEEVEEEEYINVENDLIQISKQEHTKTFEKLKQLDIKKENDFYAKVYFHGKSKTETFDKSGAPSGKKEKSFIWGEKDKEYNLILDELNRGEVASILGELLFAISETKSQNPKPVRLQNSKEDFFWPKNLNFFATMNSYDTSTDQIDQAIKRRFNLVEVSPIEGEKLNNYSEPYIFTEEGSFNFNILVNTQFHHIYENFDFNYSPGSIIKKINDAIRDESGAINPKDKLIGHSHFMEYANQLHKRCLELDTKAAPSKDILQKVAIENLTDIFYKKIKPALMSLYNDDREECELFIENSLVKNGLQIALIKEEINQDSTIGSEIEDNKKASNE